MRSGIRTPLARTARVTAILASLVLVATSFAQGQSSSAAHRRLPHRPQFPVQRAANRAGAAAELASRPNSVRSAPLRPAQGTSQASHYITEDAPSIVGDEVPSVMSSEGVPIESIWEDPIPSDMGIASEACCDGGPVCWPGFSLDHLSFYGGVSGSKNNSTRGRDASFGFHEGLNFGTAARNVILPPSVGLQLGFEAHQANIEGASFTDDDRKQYFTTAGIFYRSDCGLQGGVVYDHLWDKWNYDLEAGQIRGELSYALSPLNSIGFLGTSSTTEDDVTAIVDGLPSAEQWSTVDYYTLFYRTRFFAGGRGEAQLMAGMTEDSDGIIGGKSRLPLVNGFALETEFTYLVPDEDRGMGGNEHESWNLGVNFVWYPGTLHQCSGGQGYHRPMFDVANNGSMILKRNF